MPKQFTFPTLYNDVLQLKIAKLKSWGYLTPGKLVNATLSWNRNGNHQASISILINTKSEKPYIELNYKFNGEPRKYILYFTTIVSNLKKGLIWYFICPVTKKRCRILYLVDGYFLHRDAFENCMYETQTRSKKIAALDKKYGLYFKSDEIYSQYLKKNLKKQYAGKPTKRYLKLSQQIEYIESIPAGTMELLLLG